MNFIHKQLSESILFFKQTKIYFRDVLLLHGFLLFLMIPLLSNATKFILKKGGIVYLSTDNFFTILTTHPFVSLGLILVLLSILIVVFFEFTFLLLSMYFIHKKRPISLHQLLHLSFSKIKHLNLGAFLFFLFYFFLLLPIGGFAFHSDLLAKIKIPAFLIDFIFANRLFIVSLFIFLYFCMIYLGIRFIFVLPEMIFQRISWKQAVKHSWKFTQKQFIPLVSRLALLTGGITLATSIQSYLLLTILNWIETYFENLALISAILTMTFLQLTLLLNLILSTVSIFYIIISFMDDAQLLPDLPNLFLTRLDSRRFYLIKLVAFFTGILLLLLGVFTYNYDYLTNRELKIPLTLSHRGVSRENGVQNTIQSLKATSEEFHPDLIEMDIQMTSDGEFIVFHDFNFHSLTGVRKVPEESTLGESQMLTIHENGYTSKIPTFDEYLQEAERISQPLLIEIKTQKKNTKKIVRRFLEKYENIVLSNNHQIQSLSFDVVEQLKKAQPKLNVGYILPFNIVGPPITKANFLTMEYSTVNQNFMDAAHADQKKVYLWTPNTEETISRMIFYGADGIITDDLGLLNQSIETIKEVTYADKLLYFVIGLG